MRRTLSWKTGCGKRKETKIAGMISAIAWVPRGAAKPQPSVVQLSEEELAATRAELIARGDGDDDEGNESDESMDEEDVEREAIAHAKAAAAAITSTSRKGKGASSATDGLEAAMKELDMDHYDDSDNDDIMAR